jgi:DNA-directed RNA polymerase subunit RPC12/RpoP
LDEDSSCPECGKQLLFYPGPSRGSAAEKLADRRAEASTEEEEDMYRAVLHFLACNLLKKQDVFQFLAMGNFTENLQYALGEAIENPESTENGAVLVCPNCEEKIKSWARWYVEEEASSK